MNQFGAGFTLWADDQASPTLDNVSDRFEKFAGAAQRAAAVIGGGMVAAGVAIGRGLANAMDQAAGLETAVAEVSTLISEDAFPTEQIRAAAQRAAMLYGTEAQANAKALYQIISAGITDAAAAQKTMDASNRLAVGGLTDTRIAADGLTNVLLSYRDKQLDVNDVNDAFFTAIRLGKTTAEELAGSIGRVASGANVLGVSMDELLGTIATVTQAGIQTSEAVSGLKAAFALLNKPQAEATKEAKRLGVEYSAAAVRAQGWQAWLDKITSSAGFNADSMIKLFGSIEAYNTMVALTANKGQVFNDMMGEMANRAGATDAAVAKMSATMEHQRKVLEQSNKVILDAFGGAGNQLLAPFVGLIGKLAGAFAALADAIPPEARQAIVAVVGGIAGLLTGVGGLVLLIGGMSLLGVSLVTVAVAFGAIIAVMAPLSILTAGFGIAIFAAFRAITKHVGAAGDTWQDTMRKIKLGWTGLVDLIKQGKISQAVADELGKAENQGVGRFLERAAWWLERVKAFWDGLVKGFDAGLARLGPAVQGLLAKLGSLSTMLGGRVTDGLDSAREKGFTAGAALAELGAIGIDALGGLVDLAGKFATRMGNVTSDDVVNGVTRMADAFKVLYNTLSLIGYILDAVKRAFVGIALVAMSVGSALYETFAMIFKPIIALVRAGEAGMALLLNNRPEASGQWEKAKSGITSGWGFPTTGNILKKAANEFAGESVFSTTDLLDGGMDERPARTQFYAPPLAVPDMESSYLRNSVFGSTAGRGEDLARYNANIEKMTALLAKLDGKPLSATVSVTELARGDALVKERAESRGYEGGAVPQGAF
jgi:TP901 family phage tail tape measure protein